MVRKPEAGSEPDYSLKEIATVRTYPSFTRDLKKMSYCFLLFEVLDMAPGVTLESLQACTDAKLGLAG